MRFEPDKGSVITVLSRDDLIDIYDTCVLLECQAAMDAYRRGRLIVSVEHTTSRTMDTINRFLRWGG